MKKSTVLLVLGVVLAAITTACSSTSGGTSGGGTKSSQSVNPAWQKVIDAAKKEGVVDVRSSNLPGPEMKIIPSFEKEYGIKVNYSRKGGSGPTLSTYLTEVSAGKSDADVLMLSIAAAATVTQKDLAMPVALPNDANLSTKFAVTGAAPARAINTTFVSISYNTKQVQAGDVPQTWKDLLDPKWRGKIIMGSPQNSNSILTWMFEMQQQNGPDFLKQFAAQKPLVVDTEVDAANFLAKGERSIAVMDSGAAGPVIAQQAPVARYFPPQAAPLPTMVQVLKGAPHPNAAEVFANWMLQNDTQQQYVEQAGVASTINGAPSPAGYPAVASMQLYDYDVSAVVSARTNVLAAWTAAQSG